MRYYPQKIEKKWQGRWIKEKIYEPFFAKASKGKPDLKSVKKPFYNLMMFPYPSAEGLHVGNMYAFTGSDIYGRFKRMQGYDVFEPIGLDGFGIHSENYALKTGRHPLDQAQISQKNFYRQLQMLGNSFAWDEKLETYDPEYYKWTQWIFLQLFKNGLAYRKKAAVNWCSSCKTVLADEQVIKKSKIKNQKSKSQVKIQNQENEEIRIGVCERCETPVIKKELEQWFFRITKYTERLLGNLGKIDWSEKIKIAQRNWIGRSEGAIIRFSIVSRTDADNNADSRGKSQRQSASSLRKSAVVEVFTTRPDTLFGATYMVLAPEHKIISKIKNQISNIKKVEEYIKKSRVRSEEDRILGDKEKTGVELKGVKAINPTNGKEIPVWVADYVLASYGAGAIMAVPAHDSRDFEFSQKYNLPITRVIEGGDFPYIGNGVMINSGEFDGMPSEKAKWAITKLVGGKRKIQYRLRDWLISRQRYWGPPIPMMYCDKCGWQPVPEKDLPVKLPHIKNFRPTGTDQSPLASVEKFYKARCPKCDAWARRETDVSDTFLDSAWYYLGYLILGNQKSKIKNQKFNFDKEIIKKWLPVDMYIGGAEHAVLHLLYVRFLAMAFQDFGLVDFQEPFKKFRAHGLIIKDGAKMSKSKGNVINPDDYIKKYGADALRMYLMFLGPFDQGGDFSDSGMKGITRFLERTWKLVQNSKFKIQNSKSQFKNQNFEIKTHQAIKKVTEDIENLQYNTAISALMILLNEFEKNTETVGAEDFKTFLKLLAPFAPHITEELWFQLGNKKSIHVSMWPDYNPEFITEDTVDFIVQINGKTRSVIKISHDASRVTVEQLIKKDDRLSRYLSTSVKKVIFVPNKLINFVL